MSKSQPHLPARPRCPQAQAQRALPGAASQYTWAWPSQGHPPTLWRSAAPRPLPTQRPGRRLLRGWPRISLGLWDRTPLPSPTRNPKNPPRSLDSGPERVPATGWGRDRHRVGGGTRTRPWLGKDTLGASRPEGQARPPTLTTYPLTPGQAADGREKAVSASGPALPMEQAGRGWGMSEPWPSGAEPSESGDSLLAWLGQDQVGRGRRDV